MPCEMCGTEAPLKTAVIEGSEMRVCPDCLEYGEEKTEPQQGSGPSSGGASPTPSTSSSPSSSGGSSGGGSSKRQDLDTEEVLVEDYGQRIREARQTADLTVEELSDELNEKRSLISKTEARDHHPRDELVTKLERELDIDLMEEVESGGSRQTAGSSGSSGPVTLGDLIKEEMDED